MIVEDISLLISNVGFPIAMTIFLMVSFRKSLNENTKVMQELVIEIKKKNKKN